MRVGSECRLLDPVTGEQRAAFEGPGEWGYLASKDGLLFGSVYNTDHIVHWAYLESDMSQLFSESNLFFAMDAKTGEVKWTYKPKHSIRNNSIAIGDGLVYLIDRPLEFNDLLEAERKRRGEAPAPSTDPVTLYALDAQTGKVVWKTVENVYGTMLIASLEHDVLLMTNQFTRFKLQSEEGGKITGYRASDGKWLWESPTERWGLSSRPVLIGDTVYNEPCAWNILTGERLDFLLERSYACGIMAGCKNLLVYRSATLGYIDLTNPAGTINYGGLRPRLLDQRHPRRRHRRHARRHRPVHVQLPDPGIDRPATAGIKNAGTHGPRLAGSGHAPRPLSARRARRRDRGSPRRDRRVRGNGTPRNGGKTPAPTCSSTMGPP